MQLELDQIRTDGGTQPRASYHFGVVDAYAEDMDAGATFPPVIVFYDGAEYWLADGFHRMLATKKIERTTIDADVRQGTQQDAQWYSYSVNQAHGLRRNNDDKRRAVEAALKHPKAASMSNIDIADHCGVAESFVRKVKEEMGVSSHNAKMVTRNGTTYQQNTKNIGKKSGKPKAQPAPQPTWDDDQEDDEQQPVTTSAPTITEPPSVGEERLIQMVNELIQKLNYDDFRRFVELAAERIATNA